MNLKEEALVNNFINNIPYEVRTNIYENCTEVLMGRLFLTDKSLSIDTANLLVDRLKGLESQSIQNSLLERDSTALKGAFGWINKASPKIECLRFITYKDSEWKKTYRDSLLNKKINKLILEFRQNLSKDEIYIYYLSNHVTCPSRVHCLSLEIPLISPRQISSSFAYLPRDLSTLELQGIDKPPLYDREEKQFFENLPNLTSLTLDNWVCVKNFFSLLPRKLKNLKILRLNSSVDLDLSLDQIPPELEKFELDNSLILSASCCCQIPRTMKDLSIIVKVIYPLWVHLSQLPQTLKDLKLRVITKDYKDYLLKLKDIQSLPQGLMSFVSLWEKDITRNQIRDNLTTLTKFAKLKI